MPWLLSWACHIPSTVGASRKAAACLAMRTGGHASHPAARPRRMEWGNLEGRGAMHGSWKGYRAVVRMCGSSQAIAPIPDRCSSAYFWQIMAVGFVRPYVLGQEIHSPFAF